MWIPITLALIESKLSKAEFASITNVQLPDGVFAEDLIAEEITRTVNMVRGYVAGNRENALGDGETIPDELTDAALAILRVKIFTRIPGLTRLLDANRMREYEEAISQLKDTARGNFRLTPPETPAAAQPAGPTIAIATRPERQNTRAKWSRTL